MREETRRAFREVLREETDPAVRQWLRLMLRGDVAPKRRTRRRRRRKAAAE